MKKMFLGLMVAACASVMVGCQSGGEQRSGPTADVLYQDHIKRDRAGGGCGSQQQAPQAMAPQGQAHAQAGPSGGMPSLGRHQGEETIDYQYHYEQVGDCGVRPVLDRWVVTGQGKGPVSRPPLRSICDTQPGQPSQGVCCSSCGNYRQGQPTRNLPPAAPGHCANCPNHSSTP